jgi:hypothetical protein
MTPSAALRPACSGPCACCPAPPGPAARATLGASRYPNPRLLEW